MKEIIVFGGYYIALKAIVSISEEVEELYGNKFGISICTTEDEYEEQFDTKAQAETRRDQILNEWTKYLIRKG